MSKNERTKTDGRIFIGNGASATPVVKLPKLQPTTTAQTESKTTGGKSNEGTK